MNLMSVGDMAQAYQMRRQNVQLKERMTQLSEELTTGVKANLSEALSGDFVALSGIDRSLKTLESYGTATSEAALFTATMQNALGAAGDMTGEMGASLLSAATTTSPAQLRTATADARERFLGVVSTLNVQVGERYVFAGKTSDVRPFASGEEMLAALATASAGAVSATDLVAAVDAWFDVPAGAGGFLDTGYLGSDEALAPFRLGADESAELGVTGADPAIRDLLKGLALAALVSEGALAGSNEERARVARVAGERVLGAEGSLAILRARVGAVEGHIDQAAVRNAAETSALGIARNEMVGAEPYATASALEAVTTQMETLYTLTARLSRLSFAEYL
ncbi:flagellar biosynthesis protein FlgL [Ostreiculturibacter nitratireducens]|uniref:flagellar biosynthesis protein FlgL n=1 Tax=Ostreiculturibacter nitratireducens TaxID=3075226 RepID=UPI0031B619F9